MRYSSMFHYSILNFWVGRDSTHNLIFAVPLPRPLSTAQDRINNCMNYFHCQRPTYIILMIDGQCEVPSIPPLIFHSSSSVLDPLGLSPGKWRLNWPERRRHTCVILFQSLSHSLPSQNFIFYYQKPEGKKKHS